MNLSIVIPVFNEERRLASGVARLEAYLSEHCCLNYEIIIADNGSTDATYDLAKAWESRLRTVRAVRLEEKGRGRALKHAWLASDADILAYMDVDLSTDLTALPRVIVALLAEGFDLAVGSRLLPGSDVTRGLKREVISRSYNWMVRAICGTRFSDAQCGFKGITQRTARHLLPLVQDTQWFFDTELLVLAEKLGYRIADLPVKWTDSTDTRVKIASTAWRDIQGLLRLRRALALNKYSRFRPSEPNTGEALTPESHVG